MDDALKTRNIKIFKCWNSVFEKILWFVCDLIYVMIISSTDQIW